jgi:hypothetical protein
MKTILIPVYDGTITKNLLRTKFLSYLKAIPDTRIVLIPPLGKAALYEKEFGVPEKVIIDRTPAWKHDWAEFAFEEIFKHSIPTFFMRVRQVDWYLNQKKYIRYFGASLLRLLGKFFLWQQFLRAINLLQPIPPYIRELYERWSPDIVFAPTMIPRDEVALMRLARAHNKPVVGMAKSFDNLTSKAFLRIFPDYLIVPNATGVEEAVLLYRYPRERAIPTGICQYDQYLHPDILEDKEAFFKKLGLNPNKRTLLYAPAGDWMNPGDKETLEIILDAIDTGELSQTQVLLRLHPAYPSRTEELKGRSHLVVERPGQELGMLKNYEFLEQDVRHLASSLTYSDVVLNTASTLTVEAAIFDTPIILLGIDTKDTKNYWQSIQRYYDREHYVPIMQTHGATLVKNKKQLLQSIRVYLDDPTRDAVGRKKIVEAICYKLDGKSAERTAQVLIHALHPMPL